MPASKINIQAERNATFEKAFIWKNSKGRPFNLTGYTAKMQIRATASASSPVLFEFSTENGRIVIVPASGRIELKADLSGTTFESGVYDLVLTTADGRKIRLIEGKFSVIAGVTV